MAKILDFQVESGMDSTDASFYSIKAG